jgi:hypothetical protein
MPFLHACCFKSWQHDTCMHLLLKCFPWGSF